MSPRKKPAEPTPPYLWRHAKTGIWHITGIYPKPFRKTTHETDRKEAEAALAIYVANEWPAKRDGTQLKPRKLETLRSIADWYLSDHLPALGRARSTIENAGFPLNSFIAYADSIGVTFPSQLTSRMFQDWQAARGFKESRTRDDLRIVRKWLNEYAEMDHATLPKLAWRIPKVPHSERFRALSDDEVLATLDAAQRFPQLLGPICWMLETGWLPSDVIALQWPQVKINRIEYTRKKTGRRAMFPMTSRLHNILAQQPRHEHGYVFTNFHGLPWTRDHFKNAMYEFARDRLSFHVTPRDLRVTFATRKKAAGCPSDVMAILMGQKPANLADRHYVRTDEASVKEWAERG